MRTIINVYIRTKKPVETYPGVYEYAYIKKEKVRATMSNLLVTLTDSSSVNLQSSSKTKMSYVISNCNPDTAKRISYISYNGDLYEVSSSDPYPPRMSSVLGDIAKMNEEELDIYTE